MFSEHSYIKVYCSKIIFDVEKVNIKCKESFCIVADRIELQSEKHIIKAVKFNNEPATLIIILQEEEKESKEDYQKRMEAVEKRI